MAGLKFIGLFTLSHGGNQNQQGGGGGEGVVLMWPVALCGDLAALSCGWAEPIFQDGPLPFQYTHKHIH